jgi:hypothetical protein
VSSLCFHVAVWIGNEIPHGANCNVEGSKDIICFHSSRGEETRRMTYLELGINLAYNIAFVSKDFLPGTCRARKSIMRLDHSKDADGYCLQFFTVPLRLKSKQLPPHDTHQLKKLAS